MIAVVKSRRLATLTSSLEFWFKLSHFYCSRYLRGVSSSNKLAIQECVICYGMDFIGWPYKVIARWFLFDLLINDILCSINCRILSSSYCLLDWVRFSVKRVRNTYIYIWRWACRFSVWTWHILYIMYGLGLASGVSRWTLRLTALLCLLLSLWASYYNWWWTRLYMRVCFRECFMDARCVFTEN